MIDVGKGVVPRICLAKDKTVVKSRYLDPNRISGDWNLTDELICRLCNEEEVTAYHTVFESATLQQQQRSHFWKRLTN